MTDQELFTISATHLLTQMEWSVDPDNLNRCLYRGPGGLKCEIGPLIPDHRYTPLLEGLTVGTRDIQMAADITVDQQDLAYHIQSVHDDSGITPEEWERESFRRSPTTSV